MDWKRSMTAVPVALMAEFLTASVGAANVDCAEVPCQSSAGGDAEARDVHRTV